MNNRNRWNAISGPAILVAVGVLATAVLLLFLTGQNLLSPGPLNAVASAKPLGGVYTHAELPCSGCHAPPWSSDTMASLCLDCHKDVAIQLRGSGNVHSAAMATVNAVTCTWGCHSEHHGAAASLTAFDHSITGFPLTGKHATVDCQLCHANSVFNSSTPTSCFACHQKNDAHNGQFGQDCGSCHTTNGWTPATFNGPHPFPMNHGNRATASPCTTCHPNNLQTYSCYGCHQHTVSNIQQIHRNIQNIDDCVRCHPTGGRAED